MRFEGLPERFDGLLERYERLQEESEGLSEGSEGLSEGSEGLPEGSEGLQGGPGGDGRTYGRTYVRNFSPFYRTSSPVGAAAQKQFFSVRDNSALPPQIFYCEGLTVPPTMYSSLTA